MLLLAVPALEKELLHGDERFRILLQQAVEGVTIFRGVNAAVTTYLLRNNALHSGNRFPLHF